MLKAHRAMMAVVVLAAEGASSVAGAQSVEYIDQSRATSARTRLGGQTDSADGFAPFSSEALFEGRDWFDPCASPPPGSGPCRYHRYLLAVERSHATQESSLLRSSLSFEGSAHSVVNGQGRRLDGAVSISKAKIRFRVAAPVKLLVRGTLEMTVHARYDWAAARTSFVLQGPEGVMISQRPFCADLDTIDTPCPEGPVEIQQAVLLLPGEYSVSFEAEARAVISTGGGPMESSAKIAYTLVFWGAQLDISSTSWSAVKQLYR